MDKLPSVTMVMTQPYFTVSESSLLINPSMIIGLINHFVFTAVIFMSKLKHCVKQNIMDNQ